MRNRFYTGKTCSRCKRVYNAGMVLQCHHPRVNEIYGEGICLYCCKRCRHHETVPFMDGVRCGYEREGSS